MKIDSSETPLEPLVERARKGDESALSELVDRYQGRLYRFCFYLSGNPTVAEDLCQDTFVRVFTSLGKLKDPAKFHSWLFQISKNLFWDRLRSSGKTETLLEEPSAASDSPEVHLQITRTLARMDPQDRLVLLLVDLQGHSYREAAEILEISVEAVTSRIYRARQLFVEAYDRDERKDDL
ncbi:MAG: RNA polymerase sigma factor [Pseudomonadota bacterium]